MNTSAPGWVTAATLLLILVVAFVAATVDRGLGERVEALEETVATLEEHHQPTEMGYRLTPGGGRLEAVPDSTADVTLTIPEECSGVGIPGGSVPCVVITLAEYDRMPWHKYQLLARAPGASILPFECRESPCYLIPAAEYNLLKSEK